MGKWICGYCHAVNAGFAPTCHNCSRGNNPVTHQSSDALRIAESILRRYPEGFAEYRRRTCPACRGYSLERRYSSRRSRHYLS